MLRKGGGAMCETTMCPEEIAAIYERFPWLEKIYPQIKADHVHVENFKAVGVVSNASAYLVCADGTFRLVCKPLWPKAFLVDSKIENLEDIRCANQAVSAAYAVLIQHSSRHVTIFEL